MLTDDMEPEKSAFLIVYFSYDKISLAQIQI